MARGGVSGKGAGQPLRVLAELPGAKVYGESAEWTDSRPRVLQGCEKTTSRS
ncbi:hypothetical protein ACFXJ8_20755 [Nonomuraea sp. NPDC059194]|uniref:hypothetical protein n=1 Tax=Nonomuraea sp. NPDC059194 TaxID=3346764 RepID=UPI003688D987